MKEVMMIGTMIEKIDYYLPDQVLSNTDLEKIFPEWDSSKIEKKVGIVRRHIASDNESALDMGVKAAEIVLKDYNRADIDFLIFCTQSPEYFLPSGACIIQDKLNLRKNIGAFDINLGCSGFVYMLSLADSLIKNSQAEKILLIASETYTKQINSTDKSNRTIFGDASSAIIISRSDKNKIFNYIYGTDGSGFNKLIVKKGGFACLENYDYEESEQPDEFLYMNGHDIFNFTIDVIPGLVTDCLNKNNLNLDDIDMYIFHQANKYILDFLRKKIKIPKDKFYVNLEHTGNTVSSTIPIALKQCLDKNLIKQGDKVMIVGFGVGLSWAANIIEI